MTSRSGLSDGSRPDAVGDLGEPLAVGEAIGVDPESELLEECFETRLVVVHPENAQDLGGQLAGELRVLGGEVIDGLELVGIVLEDVFVEIYAHERGECAAAHDHKSASEVWMGREQPPAAGR